MLLALDGNHQQKSLLLTHEVKNGARRLLGREHNSELTHTQKSSWEKAGEFPVSDTEEETIAVIETQGSTSEST